MNQSQRSTPNKSMKSDFMITPSQLNRLLTIEFRVASTPEQLYTLASMGVQRYCQALELLDPSCAEFSPSTMGLASVSTLQGRIFTIKKLQTYLNYASAKAWVKVEPLFAIEMRRCGINLQFIDPWEMINDIQQLYEKMLTAYAEAIAPSRLAIILATECSMIRQKYTQLEPCTIGFVTLQFHLTGQILLEHLVLAEKTLFMPYLRVMGDCMYMPLPELYQAAALSPLNSPSLQAVQHLLPISTRIARSVYEQILRKYPDSYSYNAPLNSPKVREASIHDIETFQIYLCLSVLEGNLRCIQQELFPLCLIAYPQLKISWELLQEMLLGIFWEIHHHLSPGDVQIFLPYMRSMIEMFSLTALQ